MGVRIAAAIGIALLVLGLIGTISQLELSSRQVDVVMFVNLLEASINSLVLLAIAAVFLVSVETRIKRRRSLGAIHELVALAYVIDMHQLTKDPDRLLLQGSNTKSSPISDLGAFEISRCTAIRIVAFCAKFYKGSVVQIARVDR